MYHFRIIIVAGVLLILGSFAGVQPVRAQQINACTAAAAEALLNTGVNCSANDTGMACYGNDVVDSVLAEDVEPEAFDEPGDKISLMDVITVRPNTADLDDGTWGITAMNLQANLPSGFDEDVVVLALGGAEIESGVPLEEAFEPLETPISVTTASAGTLLDLVGRAPEAGDAASQVPAGATVQADAVSADGQQVRVIVNGQPGWLGAAAFDADDLSELPTLGEDEMTAMQSFYMRTGIGGNCTPVSSWIVIQGPQEIPVEMVVYDVPIRLESTMMLRTLSPGEPVGTQLQLVMLYGFATLYPDTPEEVIVPAGYYVTIGLGPDFVSAGIEGDEDERSGPRTVGQPTMVSQSLLGEIGIINQIPPDLLNYDAPPPLLFTPSAVGGTIITLIFPDPGAVSPLEELCATGALPVSICDVYGFPTP